MEDHTSKPPRRAPHIRLPSYEGVSKSPPASPTDSDDVLPRAISMERLSDPLSENSPLLSPTRLSNVRNSFQSIGPPLAGAEEDAKEESKSMLYLMLLTISIGGLQIAWTVELSNGTPYLLSLGLSKSLMALVWIAGPLSGTLVQPYVGIRSDNCRISWGKRKPFMLAGGIATITSLLLLGWAREIVGGIMGVFGLGPENDTVKTITIIFAVFFIYVLDFAINTVQAGIRAFIVDCAPTHQQDTANAWAGRANGVGNILGYLSGYVKLPKILPFFGNTQFKVLCVIACLALGSTLGITCLYIKERDPRLEGPPASNKPGILAFFKQVFKSIRRLPPQIRRVCQVQFFAWIGWFPVLFYITTYVGQLYADPFFAEKPNMSDEEISNVWEHATRIGTFSLLIFAITSFVSNIFLPFIVAPFSSEPVAISDAKDSTAKTSFLSKLIIPWLTMRRAWLLSHLLFSFAMFCTFFIRTPTGATIVVGIIGISWALTMWAPFALISAEISKRDALRRQRYRNNAQDVGSEDQAGIILGLHNVAIAAPQMIATLGSSLIFRALQKPRGTPYDDSVGWVLRLSAVATLVAAYMTTLVQDETDPKDGGSGSGSDEGSV